MKIIKISFLLIVLFTTPMYAQQKIVVPNQFDFSKKENEYQLNALTQFLFKKYGADAIMENELANLTPNERCEYLYANVLDYSNMFTTKVRVQLKDCLGKEVWVSEQGSSGEKEYKKAYHEALRNVFQKDDSWKKVAVPSDGKTAQSVEKNTYTLNWEQVSLSEIAPSEVYEKLHPLKSSDYSYQLVDITTSKVVWKIYKTSKDGIYIAQNENYNGVLYKTAEGYICEYYKDGQRVQEVYSIDF